jgi:cytosine/uracil/thiamine/allantoin permease
VIKHLLGAAMLPLGCVLAYLVHPIIIEAVRARLAGWAAVITIILCLMVIVYAFSVAGNNLMQSSSIAPKTKTKNDNDPLTWVLFMAVLAIFAFLKNL